MACKILLADESLNAQRLWAQCLAEMGYHVTAVSSGTAAVERMPDLRPDLVIADSALSGTSGKELCSVIRQHPEWGRIPVILTLKAFDQGTEEELRAAGASAVLRKPFSPAMLEKIVNELLLPEPGAVADEAPAGPAPDAAASEPVVSEVPAEPALPPVETVAEGPAAEVTAAEVTVVEGTADEVTAPEPAVEIDLLDAVLQEAALTAPSPMLPLEVPEKAPASILLRQILLQYLAPWMAEQVAAEIERALPPSLS